MLIRRLQLNNFRQFKGKQTLDFSCDKDKNVTVLLGDNTFGKTTILQAFNWCLYGVADLNNADFLLNYDVASENAGIQKKSEVSVILELEHSNYEYSICRSQGYIDRSNEEWIPQPSKLEISYKEKEGNNKGLSKTVPQGKEQEVINSILPRSLSGYFFFDTERVSDISKRKDLAEAVKGLLGLTQVANARKHLGSEELKTTVLGYWYTHLDTKGEELAKTAKDKIDSLRAKIEQAEDDINNYEKELESLNNQKETTENILIENKNTAELQQRRQLLENELNQYTQSKKEAVQSLLTNYSNSAFMYYMLPLMDEAEKILVDAHLEDKGIRDMTESSIRDIIERGYCICGAKIEKNEDGTGNEAYQHILDELKYLPPASIGTEIQNYKELLNSDRHNISCFFQTIESEYKSIQQNQDEIIKREEEIESIDKTISGKANMKIYNDNLNQIKGKIKDFTAKKYYAENDINRYNDEIKSNQKTIDDLVISTSNNTKLIEYMAYAKNICDWIDEQYKTKENKIKNDLEAKVDTIFSEMYQGKRHVKIDDNYNVTLLSDVHGQEIASGESEGANRVKNFAFIAGLVDLAKEKATFGKGKKDSITWNNETYPLVMDAPFSNADEGHIKNISSVLPNVANQVIMFVMNKDWQYAKPVIEDRVGKYCTLKKISEVYTEIE